MYNKMKKLMATLLATLMVASCCGVAFASETPTPGADQTVTGDGKPEGHVERTVTKMVLPTVTANTFKYIVDPEELIQETSAAKYGGEDATFPAAATDTHVYFQTGDTTWANSTKTMYAVNVGTEAVTLTVKVKAVPSTDSTKDIGLATAADTLVTSDSTPKSLLYLGFKVGDTTKVLSATEQTVTATVAGSANYEVSYNATTDKYAYTEKDPAEGAAGNSWKAMAISLEGKVGDKPIADDTTSPQVSVTWGWAAAASGATAATDMTTVIGCKTSDGTVVYLTSSEIPSIDRTTVTKTNNEITITNGELDTIKMTRTNGTVINWADGVQYNYDKTTNKVAVVQGPFTVADNANATLTLTFTNGLSLTATLDTASA